jgi:PAS domain S-box-containing protein
MSMQFPVTKHNFLAGGGEMGALTRAKDWRQTDLGDIEQWPQSLRTTLGILLHSKFPMFLFWGEDLICFYNDAYRPSLGREGKHPDILGMPGEQAWPEIWHVIKPLIDQVRSTGEATWSEDQLIPIYRNGRLEDVYWTFSYSAVIDETGNPAGVFVTCSETTNLVESTRKLAESERNFRSLVLESPISTAVFRTKEFVVEVANEAALELWGKTSEIIGLSLFDGFPELENQPYIELLRNVYETGITYEGKENLVMLRRNGQLTACYVTFVYKAIRDAAGNINGILTMGYEVTEQVLARERMEALEERARIAIDANDIGVYDLNLQTGESYFSEKMHLLYGYPSPIAKEAYVDRVHPDDKAMRLQKIAESIETGKMQFEYRVVMPDESVRWLEAHSRVFFDRGGKPLRRIGTVQDITERKLFNERLAASENRFRNTIMQAPIGIMSMEGPEFIVTMANEAYLAIVDKTESSMLGKSLFASLPEVESAVAPLLKEVMEKGTPYYGNEFPVVLNRFGESRFAYFNFVYQPQRNAAGEVTGVMAIAHEITAQVEARFAVEESRQKFSDLVMHSPIAMTIFRGPEFVIEMANETMLNNLWKKKADEVIGRSILDVFPELNDQKYPALLRKVYTTGETHKENDALAYVQQPDGMKKFYLDFEYAPLHGADGAITGIMVTVNDVTERFESRALVEDAESRLRLAAEGTGLATWDLNIQTGNILHSPRLAVIFGYDQSEKLLHRQLRERVHPEDRINIVEKAFEKALRTGTYFYEARILIPGHLPRWIRTQGKMIFDDRGNPVRLLGTVIDITESKASEEQQQRLALIVQTSDDGIISKSIDGIITSWNEGAQRIFRYTSEEIIGKHISTLIPADRLSEEDEIVRRLKRGERIAHFQSKRIDKFGRLIDVSLAISPLRDNNGHVIGASKIVRDITREKQAESLIRESEQRFRFLADNMPQFVWTATPEGEVNYYNKTVLDYTGLTIEKLFSVGWLQIIHPEEQEENLQQWQHAMQSGLPYRVEHRLRRKDGDYRWYLSTALPQKEENGNIQIWVGTSADIDDIKKHDQQKDDFIKMASHELKTPVTTIKGYVQLLLKMNQQANNPFLSSSLQTIDKQVYKLTKLITDLLDVTKIETGSLEMSPEHFPIATLVKEIINDLQTTSASHQLQFVQEADPLVFADRDRIAQVIINLLTNAIKYSPRASEVIITVREDDGNAMISVTDYGIGISKEDLPRIFDRFYRAAGKDEKTFPGFGIGLFIVNEIVSLHHGRIWAESQKDSGSTFFITLPANNKPSK